MTDIAQRLRDLPDMRPEPEPFEVWRDACGVALAGADTIERLRAALRRLLDMDVAYGRGPKVEEAVAAARAALGE